MGYLAVVTPDDTTDPLREHIIPEALEVAIDRWLMESFFDPNDKGERKLICGVDFRDGAKVSEGMCLAVVTHYRNAGWSVRWDNDSSFPYFFFKLPRPRKRRRWYAPWR
jgi:hypothetical protein